MDLVREGRVWKFGDQINTDLMLPGSAFRLPKEEQHMLCFEAIRPGWVKEVREGDILIGGRNFGLGSGRPVGAVLHTCGIRAVLAESINGLCLRNCINVSLPAMNCPGVSALFEEGDTARIDFRRGRVENLTRGGEIDAMPLPGILVDIVQAGGIVEMLIAQGFIESEPFLAARS
ncbi:hypothetical protein [Afifella sp. IM 167]|uniref:LeuD/DmdB family oxidoreductase small subunit n=1 Tax=Afifella sp. IM 167 TaxID=2033586 RepID=UPI001CCEF7C4|nr:hypothetical protein [Afifella sp. IM 167]MBZ8134784.1 3-isopropylmalate dehydratase [Afifella sp. IM 167]